MAVDQLIKLLSTAFRKDSDSNIYRLLKVIDSEYSNIEQAINDVKNAHFVDFASGKSLDYLATLFGILRQVNESDEHFRARVKFAFSKISDMGTINDIKEIVATTLNTTTSRVVIKENPDYEAAYFEIWLWLQDLNSAGLTVDEFQELVKAIKPAGVRVVTYQQGTFTYRSVSETSDPTKGYNDLSNSNPDAGTYAGLL